MTKVVKWSNSCVHSLRGDGRLLPAIGRLSLLPLGQDEELTFESEDLQKQMCSACSRSRQPACATEMRTSGLGHLSWAGWRQLTAQAVVRRICYEWANITKETGVHLLLFCLDGVEKLSRTQRGVQSPGESHAGTAFVDACKRLDVPLNVGKRVTQAAVATLWGADVDGREGRLLQSRQKSEALASPILTLLNLEKVPGVGFAACGWCVAVRCSLPAPLYSLLSEACPCLARAEWPDHSAPHHKTWLSTLFHAAVLRFCVFCCTISRLVDTHAFFHTLETVARHQTADINGPNTLSF